MILETIWILLLGLFPNTHFHGVMVLKDSPVLEVKSGQLNPDGQDPRILKVPAEYPTIASAVENSNEGDWIILLPGSYAENEIEINKRITISSEWKLSGDEKKIDQTVVDAGDKRLFMINANGVEISGLRIINGDHTLDISAEVSINHNHFVNNLDGMSFESGGGGYAGYNIAENDRDDALDLDITVDQENKGSDILVEHNLFINSHDDGIEIRLFKSRNQNIKYIIRKNQIIGSNNAAVQLISYDEYTGKEFDIHHNILINCKTGLGCMGGAKTREDLSGTSRMDERVFFYNNTISGCKMGATGGNNILAFNNLVMNNSLGGFKRFGPASRIINNLFFRNGTDDFIEIAPEVVSSGNIFSNDPLIDQNTFYPEEGSLCIDGGIHSIRINDSEPFQIAKDEFTGTAPEIGAIERGLEEYNGLPEKTLQVYAGEDRVIGSTANDVVLAGRILNADDRSFECRWEQVMGPAEAQLLDPGNLVTEVNLKSQGIYRFSISCSDGGSTASDFVTIRYIQQGEGRQLFLNDEQINTIEGGDFAYSYGLVRNSRRGYLKMKADDGTISLSQIEYSVGMAEENVFDLWFLIKAAKPGENILRIEFNQKEIGELSTDDKKFRWVKLLRKVSATAGQWQFLIMTSKGQVYLDKIIFSSAPDFIPH